MRKVEADCFSSNRHKPERQTAAMKLLTILGTRPEFIRLSQIIRKLDGLCCHVIVHTGQNYDVNLNDVFFQEMGIRAPDHYLRARGSFGEQIGTILTQVESVLREEKPDRFLVLGDTNSSLAAIVAKRMGIPVYHMEAGNRCYDDGVPEEVNRRLIDHSSDILLPYTERSRQNLLAEGIPGQRIYVTGNPIKEVLDSFENQIASSPICKNLNIEKNKYFLVTLHREENVDIPDRLRKFAQAFEQLVQKYDIPLIWSIHPRTRKQLELNSITLNEEKIKLSEPFGLFDFVHLEKNAFCVLSDSGTVQEECCIFKIPN